MRSFSAAVCAATVLATGWGVVRAEPSDLLVPQPPIALAKGGSSTWKADWKGVTGRTYLMQWSEDMLNWNYFPLTESGAGSKGYGFASSTEKFFVRLNCTDETPDIAKTSVWQPPLLIVGGEWTVVTRHPNGDPASGVGLTFRRLPAASSVPLPTPILKATTDANGSYTLNPGILTTGDRVEVRISGSPNQRVYLPWLSGHEVSDPGLSGTTLGGNGLSLSGIVVGPGTGRVPDLMIPNGGGSPNPEDAPVFRFEDYLTYNYSEPPNDLIKTDYPSALHQVTEDVTTYGISSSSHRETPEDTVNWANRFIIGSAYNFGSRVEGDPYGADFQVEMGDNDLEIPVQRTIFVDPELTFTQGVVPYSDPVYPPVVALFKDGVVHDWGIGELPYDLAECPLSNGFTTNGGESFQQNALPYGRPYKRQLVLGPVPCHVPLSVMTGGTFYYGHPNDEETGESAQEISPLQRIKLYAELPLGCKMSSYFRDADDPAVVRTDPSRIVWTATVHGPAGLQVSIHGAHKASLQGVSSTLEEANDEPRVHLIFIDTSGSNMEFQESFSVTLTAKASIANQELPPTEPGGDFDYHLRSLTELGEFTTNFEYSENSGGSTPVWLARNQIAELAGASGSGSAPEASGFNGGQRLKSSQPEWRIGVTGRPAPESPTYVEALTGRFRHTEADFLLAIPGSDLSLMVTRSATDSVWNNAFGLSPLENPQLVFGGGWESNMTGSMVRISDRLPDGTERDAPLENLRNLKSRISVRDYRGVAYGFLEYTKGNGTTVLLADPTMVPDRSTSGISLASTNGTGFTLTQPALGLVHTYQKVSVDFRIAGLRDVPTSEGVNETGFTRFEYFRLISVTDRFGVALNYTYGENAANIIPDSISVQGRAALTLRFKHSGGRIDAFWDPSGVKHSYTYAPRTLTGAGSTPTVLELLASHRTGDIVTSSYGYHYQVEQDPRPPVMLLKTAAGTDYTIPTCHLTPNEVCNGMGNAITIQYGVSDARWAWSVAGNCYYHPAGDPLVVEQISLPNTLATHFSLQHTLKNGRPAIPADGTNPEIPAIPSVYSVATNVTTMEGDHWSYSFGTPSRLDWKIPLADAAFLPTASALFFPTLVRSCTEIPNSAVQYQYDAAAGFKTARTGDEAGRSSSLTYNEAYPRPNPLYLPPRISASKRLNSCFGLPSTSTDWQQHTTTFSYTKNAGSPDHMQVASITDSRSRMITPVRGQHARTESIKLEKESTLLSQIDYGYDATLPGAVSKITRKALGGSGDPAWVTDLVKDIQLDSNGFPRVIGSNAGNLHTTITRGPSGRVLSVAKSNGGVRSYQYDQSGLLEKTFLEDGSGISYGHDPAGRTVFLKDAMGVASGIEFDPMGRMTKAVRDMNGNLGFNPAGGLTGVDAGTDLVASTQFLDTSHEIRMTDPRGFISVRRFNAFGQTVKTITPGNDCAAGNVPSETNDRVTDIVYDVLESPDSPVSVSDPSGYETIYNFDELARLTKILREYGEDASNNDLYSGTIFGYDSVTGLPNAVTAIRTPLDEDGNPVGQTLTDEEGNPTGEAVLEQLTTRIERDELDRVQATVFAAGTDKELHSKDSYTSTGIRWRKEVRDFVANETYPDHWNDWELTYDSLGRPTRRTLPETIDALDGLSGRPFTDYFYGADGSLSQTADSYGNATSYGYDIRGRLSYQKDPAVKDAKSGETLEPVHIYEYDANGQLVHTVDPLGYAWDYVRDAAGRVKTATGPIVSPAASSNHRRPVWEKEYDPAGNLLQVIDPEGRTRSLAYYPDNQVKDVTTPVTFKDESGSPSLIDVVEHYTRDSLGRVIQVEDGEQQITSFTFDGLGRQLTTTRDPGDARAKIERINYDALLPTSIEDAAGLVKQLGYDDQFRLSRVDVIGKPAESLDYSYDLLGRITAISPVVAPTDLSMGDPSISRSYDTLGLLSGETSNGVSTTYGYDLNGQLSKVSNSANARILSIQHDAAGRNSRVVDSGFGGTLETHFGHDLSGNLVREEMSNGLVQESDFDPIHRVTSQRLRNASSGSTVNKIDYQYDLLSNVTRIEESTSLLNVPDRIVENTYNERNQLISEVQTQSGGSLGSAVHRKSEIHRYDAAENRISTEAESFVNGQSTSTLGRVFDYGDANDQFNSNQLHQLTETTGTGNPVVSTYAYDDNGNRTGKTVGSANDAYTYDSFGRLTQLALNTAAPSENGIYQYAYDPLTRRIARRAESQTAHQFAFSGTTPVHEWDAALNNGSLVDHIGGGIGGRLYSQSSGGLSYPVNDLRGDVVAQVTAGGTMTWHGTYNASGMLEGEAGIRSGDYGANGKWEEPGGLINDGFRYRDRLTGTFISRDPAGFIDGPNTYNYVGHNPWSAWDPDGLASYMAVPSGTNDIGYVGQPSSIPAISTDPNGGLPPDTSTVSDPSSPTVGAGSSGGLDDNIWHGLDPSLPPGFDISRLISPPVTDSSLDNEPGVMGFIKRFGAVMGAAQGHDVETDSGKSRAIAISILRYKLEGDSDFEALNSTLNPFATIILGGIETVSGQGMRPWNRGQELDFSTRLETGAGILQQTIAIASAVWLAGEGANISTSTKAAERAGGYLHSRPMIVDENLSPTLMDALKSRGFDPVRMPNGTADADIIKWAQKNNASVLTGNTRDFVGQGVTVLDVPVELRTVKAAGELADRLRLMNSGQVSGYYPPTSSTVLRVGTD